MRDIIYELISSQEGLSTQEILAHIIMSAILGIVIFFSYTISHRGTIYSKKFGVSLLLLTAITGMIMTVIGNNVALSLGMVGALSIVRFRTALKDTRDTVFVFWAIAAGICCGVGDYVVAAAGCGVIFLLLLLFGGIKSDNRMLLIIRGSRAAEAGAKSLAFRLFSSRARLRVENTTEESFELIYELTVKLAKKAEKRFGPLTDPFYELGQIEYVNLVMQNDEIAG